MCEPLGTPWGGNESVNFFVSGAWHIDVDFGGRKLGAGRDLASTGSEAMGRSGGPKEPTSFWQIGMGVG
jgi:hypothetical protein